jgi:hypothetical protein
MDKALTKGNYPCAVEGRLVRPCTSLERALDQGSPSSRSKGLFMSEVIDLETGKFTMSFIRLKLGGFSKKGVVINFCPFCGRDISGHIKRGSHDGA